MRAGTRAAVRLPQYVGLALMACTGPPADQAAQAFLTYDSGGVRIVEIAGATVDAAAPWTITDSPVAEIGSPEDSNQGLFSVRGALRLPAGGILVANAGTQELRFYGANGESRAIAGGKGEGPGEFLALDWVGMVADSILAYDWRLGRVSVFDTAGSLARLFGLGGSDELGTLRVFGTWADERLLLVRQGETFTAGEARSGVHGDSLLALRFDLNGDLVDTVARVPTTQRFVSASPGAMVVIPLPFGQSPGLVTDVGGFWLGSSRRWEVEWRNPKGQLVRAIRVGLPNRAVRPDDVEQATAQLLRESSETFLPALRRILVGVPWPEEMPAYDALLVDAEGNLWIREFVPEWEQTTRWVIIAKGGSLRGVAKAPRTLTFLQISGSEVLALRRDDLDVEYVGVYAIHRDSVP